MKVTVGNTNKQSQQSKKFYQIIFKLSEDNSICVFFVWVKTDPSNRLWHKYSKETVLLVFMSVYSNISQLKSTLHQSYDIGINLMLLALRSESYQPKCSWVTNSISKCQLEVAWYQKVFHFGQKMYQIKLLSIFSLGE